MSGMTGMMGWYGGADPYAAALMTLIVVAVVAAVTWLLVRRPPDGEDVAQAGSPQEILDRRFAHGDIDLETYQTHRAALDSARVAQPPRPPRG